MTAALQVSTGPCPDAEPILALVSLVDDTAGLPGHKRVAAMVGAPSVLWAAMVATRRLRTVSVTLPASETGREIRKALRARTGLGLRNSVAAGVLELPSRSADYFVGRKRQALRTNTTRARAAGITCREVRADELATLLTNVLSARGSDVDYMAWLIRRVAGSRGRHWVAEFSDGTPAAVASVTVAGEWALLSGMVSVPSAHRSAVRFLLSGHVFRQLADDGVRFVATGSTLVMSPGLVYFQRRLGFEARRMKIA